MSTQIQIFNTVTLIEDEQIYIEFRERQTKDNRIMKIKEQTTPRRQQFPISKFQSTNLTGSNVSFSIQRLYYKEIKKNLNVTI